jgi:hypothetical protein
LLECVFGITTTTTTTTTIIIIIMLLYVMLRLFNTILFV